METNTGETQDTRASPNSLETYQLRKWGHIRYLRALSQRSNGWMDGWMNGYKQDH